MKKLIFAFFLLSITPAFAEGGSFLYDPSTNLPYNLSNPLPVTGSSGGSSPPYNASVIANSSQFGVALTTVTMLTVPAAATYGRVCIRIAEVETTEDGTAPTTAPHGTAFPSGSCTPLSYNQLVGLKMISATGTADVEYFK